MVKEFGKQGSGMKLRVLIPLILLVILSLLLFSNQAEVGKEVPIGLLIEEKKVSSLSHMDVTLDTNTGSTDSTVSKTLPKETNTPQNKQESSQIDIEHSTEFVNPKSKLHKRLLEKIKTKISEKRLLKISAGEKGVDLDGESYTTYTSDIGIEFHKESIEWFEQFDGIDGSFERVQELQSVELARLGDWNAHNESVIYQLVEEFNYGSFEEHGLPNISPVNVDCRGNICSVHFSHPHNYFNKSGEKVYADNLKAIMAFIIFFKTKRSWCKCRGFEYFSDGWNESSFRFVFD